jgi:hypothetical protein
MEINQATVAGTYITVLFTLNDNSHSLEKTQVEESLKEM